MLAAKIPELDFYARLNADFHSDLLWWHSFLTEWNGVSFLHLSNPDLPAEVVVQTDASGNWGKWLQWKWPDDWSTITIMVKELVPIVLSCAVWGPLLVRKRVLFLCDNIAVVNSIQKGSSKEPQVMQLLRSLWFFVARFDISVSAKHIAGVMNSTADQLSRNKMSKFFCSNPQANLLPTPLPAELLEIVSLQGPDWTSENFAALFNITMAKV